MDFDPKKYRELIESLEIEDIRLTHLELSNLSEKVKREVDIKIEHEITKYTRDGQIIVVPACFKVFAKKRDTNIDVFSIIFTISAEFTLVQNIEIDDQYIQFFVEKNAPVNIWPFSRELVMNITTRMGLPPLTLPMLKVVG